MRSGQIQHAIAQGMTPFALCHLVSKKIRTGRKQGDHIQDSIGAVFHTLHEHTRKPVQSAGLESSAMVAEA